MRSSFHVLFPCFSGSCCFILSRFASYFSAPSTSDQNVSGVERSLARYFGISAIQSLSKLFALRDSSKSVFYAGICICVCFLLFSSIILRFFQRSVQRFIGGNSHRSITRESSVAWSLSAPRTTSAISGICSSRVCGSIIVRCNLSSGDFMLCFVPYSLGFVNCFLEEFLFLINSNT